MRFYIAITTYSRLPYLKTLVDSIIKTVSDEHEYVVAINDDGSRDGSKEFLKTLENTHNIKWITMFSDNRGSYFTANTLFSYAESIEFDLGFCLDDDLYFTRKGWEMLYYDAYKESGFDHLSHYSTIWSGENKIPNTSGLLQSHTDVWNSQGAFYTFTKNALKEVGYLDYEVFGKRGEGHRDWSLRACRLGMNEKDIFWDAKGSEMYVKLHPKKGYILTPNYNAELQEAKLKADGKKKYLNDENRIYIPLSESVINHYFDHVYLINLKRRPDRLDKMKSLLGDLKINYEVIEAIDGKTDLEAQSISLETGIDCGVVGCHLSHLKVYRDILSKGYERPLILEDDLIAHKDFDNILLNINEVPEDWHLLYLGTADWNFKENKKNIVKGVPYYRGLQIDSTFAYAIKRDILTDLIPYFEEPITKPCDTSLHLLQMMYPSYIMLPQPFIADVTDSDLRESRKMKDYALKVNWNLKDYDIEIK